MKGIARFFAKGLLAGGLLLWFGLAASTAYAQQRPQWVDGVFLDLRGSTVEVIQGYGDSYQEASTNAQGKVAQRLSGQAAAPMQQRTLAEYYDPQQKVVYLLVQTKKAGATEFDAVNIDKAGKLQVSRKANAGNKDDDTPKPRFTGFHIGPSLSLGATVWTVGEISNGSVSRFSTTQGVVGTGITFTHGFLQKKIHLELEYGLDFVGVGGNGWETIIYAKIPVLLNGIWEMSQDVGFLGGLGVKFGTSILPGDDAFDYPVFDFSLQAGFQYKVLRLSLFTDLGIADANGYSYRDSRGQRHSVGVSGNSYGLQVAFLF